jgi:putative hydrolase of the HAD superfamily
MVRWERGLSRLLRRLPGRKILLTNAPTAYSHGVMRHIGLQRHFAHHIAIEDMRVHGQLRPKPSKLMLRRLLRKHGLAPRRCVLVEDTLVNLKHAKRSACARPGSRNTCATAIRSARPRCRKC